MRKDILCNIICSLWSIWKERNLTAFQNDSFDKARAYFRSIYVATEWKKRMNTDLQFGADFQKTQATHCVGRNQVLLTRWIPPTSGYVKLNFR